jgi:UDP-glucose 4-epimerase
MNVLVVGGAGYIGSHATRLLAESGHRTIVLDNLCYGHRQAVGDCPLVVGELSDRGLLVELLREHEIDAVMHFAAFAFVGESVQHPAIYYQNNVSATLELLEAMRATGVWRFVFSSTTATYGQPERMPITEQTPQQPINPYGFTKLVVERALEDYARAYGFGVAALRYFNAAGAHPDGTLGEDHTPETHLIPLVLQVALGQRPEITIFGDDYPTEDGSCVRDYVHVQDLAAAHLRSLELLEPGSIMQLNLGTGRGYSVKQVIESCRQVTGHPIPSRVGPRRAGDPALLIADASAAADRLQWRPQFPDLESIVKTAWKWHSSHPDGYLE